MKTKLELKDIACYLPYGLKFVDAKDHSEALPIDHLYLTDEPRSIISKPVSKRRTIGTFNHVCSEWDYDEIKILLRPLTDLTKEIDHGGYKFVPIVELTKLASINKIPDETSYDITDEGELEVFCIVYNKYGNQVANLTYSKVYPCFTVYRDMDYDPTDNYDLFQKLIEWHFDVNGLIDKGLAIDINTL